MANQEVNYYKNKISCRQQAPYEIHAMNVLLFVIQKAAPNLERTRKLILGACSSVDIISCPFGPYYNIQYLATVNYN
jgi:hypothetical protein